MKWKPPFRGHSGTLAHRGVLSLDGSSHGADSRPGSTSSLVTPSEDGPRLLRSRGKPDSATGAMALGVACSAVPTLASRCPGRASCCWRFASSWPASPSGFVETGQHALVAAHAPASLRGSAFGALASTRAFGNFAASAVPGSSGRRSHPEPRSLYLTAWMLAGLVALTLAKQKPESHASEPENGLSAVRFPHTRSE